MSRRAAVRVYGLVALVFVVVYAVVTPIVWGNRTWDDDGPLALKGPEQALPAGFTEDSVKRLCEAPDPDVYTGTDQVRGGVVRGEALFACYEIEDGEVFDAWVINRYGVLVRDPEVLKDAGVWGVMGGVKSANELWWGGVALVMALLFWFQYYRVSRPGEPKDASRRQKAQVQVLLASIPVFGWAILAGLRDVSRERRIRAMYQGAVVMTLLFGTIAVTDPPKDGLTWFVYWMLGLAMGFGFGFGRFVLVPDDFGMAEQQWRARQRRAERRGAERDSRSPQPTPAKPAASPPAPSAVPSEAVTPAADEQSIWQVERPEALPSFGDVGGMDALKAELRETIGLSLAFAGEAESYKLTWNGILLHGRPGTGKTFVARATAGEFGLNFIHVSSGDLVSAYRGESGRNVDEVFEFAARNVPCLLFFDEFDSIAQNREDWPDQEARRTVNQLLQSIVEFRVVREQIVMAATNHVEQLDPAVIRPGRFDRLIRLDLPDEEGRAEIFRAALKGRPVAAVDVADLARRSAGMTPAAIAHTVEVAAIAALRRTASSGGALSKITEPDLVSALGSRGGDDRPAIEGWSWSDLVLPQETLDELQQLQYLVEDPELARSLGVEPPSGVLLTGPPGTGKTTIARVLAAQASCSFYPVTAGDLTSMWLGESEKSVQRLFERARDNRPSIVFIDEIDAIASRRGEWGSYDRQINELLAQIDGIGGQQGVLVLAATNRPDQLDPALLRGGRLSRTIEIPLPDAAGRLRLLELFTRKMPLRDVDLRRLAKETEGASGADLRALCQQAALAALVRVRKSSDGSGASSDVTGADFDEAVLDWVETRENNA